MPQPPATREPQATAEEAILKLTADLREMDQLVFSMGQCDSWARMQPIFSKLHEITMRRMQAESNRIRATLVPEIVRTYLEHKS